MQGTFFFRVYFEKNFTFPSIQVELFPLQNDTEFPEGSENTLKN